MRKHYLSVFALAMVLIFGLASLAKAQHTVSVSSAPRTDYSNVGETFAATDIAEALATDTASLHELIMKEGGGAIYLSIADGETNEYTGNTNEFWLNGEGAPVAYGAEGCCWFVGITYNDPYVDEETQEKVDGKVYVYTGQYPDFFKKIYDPSVLKCQLAIVSGEKKVTFDITQNVEAAKKSELAEADTLLSKLNIVAEYEAEMQFVTGKQYEGKTATVAMSDVYEKLGAGVEDLDAFKADLESALTDHIFAECTYFKKENDVVTYYKSDTLRLPETVAQGSWFGRYINFNEDTGEEVAMESNLLKAWSAGCTFYTQSPKLADGEFSFTYGQYPNTMKAGDTDYAYLYVIVGGNAVRIKVQAKVADPEAIDPDKMVKVGEETVQIEAAIDNDYQTKSFTIDMVHLLHIAGDGATVRCRMVAACRQCIVDGRHGQVRAAGGTGTVLSAEFVPKRSHVFTPGFQDVMGEIRAGACGMVDIGIAGTDIDDGIVFRLSTVIFHPAIALGTDPCTAADDDLLRQMVESKHGKRQNRIIVCDITNRFLRDFGIGEKIDVLHTGLADLMPEAEGSEHRLPTVQEVLIEGETAVLRTVVLDIFLFRLYVVN